ncbi:MAG: hypothetical protein QXO21_06535, partial [Candidatus Anstonellales archaeon]
MDDVIEKIDELVGTEDVSKKNKKREVAMINKSEATALAHILPSARRVKVYKIQEGKMAYIRDYTPAEILRVGSFDEFVRQVILPKRGPGEYVPVIVMPDGSEQTRNSVLVIDEVESSSHPTTSSEVKTILAEMMDRFMEMKRQEEEKVEKQHKKLEELEEKMKEEDNKTSKAIMEMMTMFNQQIMSMQKQNQDLLLSLSSRKDDNFSSNMMLLVMMLNQQSNQMQQAMQMMMNQINQIMEENRKRSEKFLSTILESNKTNSNVSLEQYFRDLERRIEMREEEFRRRYRSDIYDLPPRKVDLPPLNDVIEETSSSSKDKSNDIIDIVKALLTHQNQLSAKDILEMVQAITPKQDASSQISIVDKIISILPTIKTMMGVDTLQEELKE